MKRYWFLPILIGGLMTAGSASAGGYGMAGCGLGTYVIKQNNWMQIFAMTSNGFAGSQFWGVLSGTSNCTGSSAEMAALFITINKDALQKDISRGQGETLTSLSRIYECGSADQLGSKLQSQYGELFTAPAVSGEEVSRKIEQTIKSDQKLAQSCKIFS